MNRPLFSLKQIIPVLIVIVTGVLPLYAQQNSQTDIFQAAAQSNQDGPCFGPSQDKNIRGYAVLKRKSPVHPDSGVRADLSKEARLEFIDNGVPPNAVNNPTPPFAPDTQTNSLRYSAGGTPAVPVKRFTLVPRTNANEATGPLQDPTNQTPKDPYVFPTPKERFNRYLRSMFGPSALIRSAVAAGINQWQDSPEEWEQGMSGYGKRFGSSFGRNAVHHTIVYGLDSMLGWDTGFRKSGKKEFGARLKHALLENITSRTKSGKRVFSVPRVVGAYASGVISREAWYPERYNWKDGLRSGNDTMLMGFVLNIAREFVVKF
ncbi:MAG TPA: hypothetical protein VJU84_13205 [Pyrinomonadaceae bacterium]|nr:hypothetical protein [Pyrinomonadaceae bacterium]